MSSSERLVHWSPGRAHRPGFVPAWNVGAQPDGATCLRAREAIRLLAAAVHDELRFSRTSEWENFARRVDGQIHSNHSGSLQAVRRLADAAPAMQSAAFRELTSLLQENNADFLAESGLNFARELAGREQHTALSLALLQFATTREKTGARARSFLQVMMGNGSWASRFEFQSPQLMRELSSPIALGSFGLAGLAARGTSMMVLARASRVNLSTVLFAEGAALATEVPTLVISRRAATQLLAGGQDLLSPRQVGEEMLHMLAPFALLRGTGNLFQWADLRTRTAIRTSGSSVSRGAESLLAGGRFASEVGAVMGGHSLNAYFGLERASGDGFNRLFDGILTVAHMRVAGHIIERSGIFRLPGGLDFHRSLFVSDFFSSGTRPSRPNPRQWFPQLTPEFALAGIGGRESSPRNRLPDFILSMSQGPDSTGGPRPGKPGTSGETEPAPSEIANDLATQKAEEYIRVSEEQETVLKRAANLAVSLWDRFSSKTEPREAGPPEPADTATPRDSQIEEQIETELRRYQTNYTRIKEILEETRLFLRRAGRKEDADNGVAPHIKQEEQRSGIATSLHSLLTNLRNIRQQGWNQDRRESLNATLAHLNKIFQTTVFRIPGAQRWRDYREQQNLLEDRRLGALLGLAVRPELGRYDSPIAREQRGETVGGGRPDDFELELLHRTLDAFGRIKPRTKDVSEGIQKIAGEYQARMDSTAAMVLYAEALHAMTFRNLPAHELITHLSQHEFAGELREQLLTVESLKDSEGEPGEGLEIIGNEAMAGDYLATGLLAMVRSQGDPEALGLWLNAARAQNIPGFHPSIAVSLFGATHGRSNLPEELLIDAPRLEALLKRLGED